MQQTTIIKIILFITISATLFFISKRPAKKNADNILIVGTNAEYQPFCFVQNDKIVGLDINIIEEVARRLNKKIKIKDMSFTTLIPELQSGKIQIIAAGISPTKERAQQMLFATPHYKGAGAIIIAPKEHPLTALSELSGKTVIVNEGFITDKFISDLPNINIIRLASVADAFLAISRHRADAFVAPGVACQPYFDQYGSENFVITPIPGTQEVTALAVSNKLPELHEHINAVIDEMIQDGTIEQIKRTWGLS